MMKKWCGLRTSFNPGPTFLLFFARLSAALWNSTAKDCSLQIVLGTAGKWYLSVSVGKVSTNSIPSAVEDVGQCPE